MRPILLPAVAFAALTVALPAQAQRNFRECEIDRIFITGLLEQEAREGLAAGRAESANRERYAALNREIAELNVSGRNPGRLMQLRSERAQLLASLNAPRPPAGSPENDRQIARARARMQANKCRPAPYRVPWESLPESDPVPAEKPWQRPAAPVARPDLPSPARPAPLQYSAWMTGAFSTGWGRMTLSTGGGTYEFEGGSIEVDSIQGAVMEGKWRQTGSGGCPDGGHWGGFKFTFTANGFTGVFGHCGGPLNQGSWNGSRIR